MKIKNAVVPVAGFGTRLLPATKSQPKEMLPVGKKPVVQYVVEELEANGIERILFVTGKNKSSIEDHFDFDNELMRLLRENGKEELLAELEFERMNVNFYYVRQRKQKGLGDAILYAEHFAGEEPFVVALGDSIIGLHGESAVVKKMTDAFNETKASCIVAVEEVPKEEVSHYGIVKPSHNKDIFQVLDLVEKPIIEEAPSNLAIAGRYVFSPNIFNAIRETSAGKGGEIQITDAMKNLMKNGDKIFAVKLASNEKRYDIGNFESYFETVMEFIINDPVYGPKLKNKLKNII